MGHTYDKLDNLQREKVWELKEKGLTGVKIAELLGVGFPREDPPIKRTKITPQAVNALYRSMQLERDQLYFRRLASIPTAQILALNRRKISQIAAAEAERLRVKQERGQLDGEQLRKLAKACEQIETWELRAAERTPVPDPERKPRGQKPDQVADQEPPSFADSLLAEAAQRERDEPEDPALDQGSTDHIARAVPDDLPRQDTTNGSSDSATAHDGLVGAPSTSQG